MSRIWRKAARKLIVERDDGKCIYCGKLCNGVDHVIPVSAGGLTISANGVCCCRSCNSKKGANLNSGHLITGLARLIQHGEDISWIARVDRFKEEMELKQPAEIELYYIEKMLRDGLEPFEISQLLKVDIEIVNNYITVPPNSTVGQ